MYTISYETIYKKNVYIIKTGYTIDIQKYEHIRINMHQSHIFVSYLYTRMF